MSENALTVLDTDGFGPAMLALPNEHWQRFVLVLVDRGCSQEQAAKAAGFGTEASSDHYFNTYGSRIYRDARTQLAILEECQKIIRRDAPMALSVVRQIAMRDDLQPRDRLAAAKMLLERSGLSATTTHVVEVKQSRGDLERELMAMFGQLGLDDEAKAKLLGPHVIDVTPEPVEEFNEDGSRRYGPGRPKKGEIRPPKPEPTYRKGSPEQSAMMKKQYALEQLKQRVDPDLAEIL